MGREWVRFRIQDVQYLGLLGIGPTVVMSVSPLAKSTLFLFVRGTSPALLPCCPAGPQNDTDSDHTTIWPTKSFSIGQTRGKKQWLRLLQTRIVRIPRWRLMGGRSWMTLCSWCGTWKSMIFATASWWRAWTLSIPLSRRHCIVRNNRWNFGHCGPSFVRSATNLNLGTVNWGASVMFWLWWWRKREQNGSSCTKSDTAYQKAGRTSCIILNPSIEFMREEDQITLSRTILCRRASGLPANHQFHVFGIKDDAC